MTRLIALFSFVIFMYGGAIHAESYQAPTISKSVIDFYGYHDDQFYSGVTWDTNTSLSKHRNRVLAPLSGTISSVGENEHMGKFIRIQHTSELSTLLAHLDGYSISEGDQVKAGEEIAKASLLKPLYHEITFRNVPIDPASVIGFEAEDFEYLYVEAIDEIERGPHLLISDLDFDQWQTNEQSSFAQASAAASAAAAGDGITCTSGSGEKVFDGQVHYCCDVPALGDGENGGAQALYVPETCDCDYFNDLVRIRIADKDVRLKVLQSNPYGEPPTSVSDLACWDQIAAIEGNIGGIYQGPAPLAGPAADFSELVNEGVVPIADAWKEGFYGPDINGYTSLAVYSYMQAQEFLDRAVDIVNNAVRSLIGGLLNSITGGIVTDILGLNKEYACDTMFRLWNVAENCFDIKIPEIPDLLGRIELPRLPCVLEEFAYGGKGLRDVRNMVRQYEPGGAQFEPYTGLYGISVRLDRDRNRSGWRSRR